MRPSVLQRNKYSNVQMPLLPHIPMHQDLEFSDIVGASGGVCSTTDGATELRNCKIRNKSQDSSAELISSTSVPCNIFHHSIRCSHKCKGYLFYTSTTLDPPYHTKLSHLQRWWVSLIYSLLAWTTQNTIVESFANVVPSRVGSTKSQLLSLVLSIINHHASSAAFRSIQLVELGLNSRHSELYTLTAKTSKGGFSSNSSSSTTRHRWLMACVTLNSAHLHIPRSLITTTNSLSVVCPLRTVTCQVAVRKIRD